MTTLKMNSYILRFAAITGVPCLLLALLYLLLGPSTAVQAQRATTTPTPVTLPTATPPQTSSGSAVVAAATPMGYLTFSHNESSGSGDFHLVLDGLAPAGDDSFYMLWLISPQTETLALGAFTALDGRVNLTGTTALNLAGRYTEARVTLEVAANENSDADAALTMSDRVVLSATRPPAIIDLLRPFLQFELNDGSAEAEQRDEAEEEDEAAIAGALTAAQAQMQIAVRHTGFLRDSLSETDLPGARRHSEHINNILDGESGFSFSDLDRNGLAENPGDGVGVRVYLATVRKSLEELAELPDGQERLNELVPIAGSINLDTLLPIIDENQVLVDDIFNKVIQIFSSDTVNEANGFALDLRVLVDTLNANVSNANDTMLEAAAYSFFGPPQAFTLPQQDVPTVGTTLTTTSEITTSEVAAAGTKSAGNSSTATPRGTTPTAKTQTPATPARQATATRAPTQTAKSTTTPTRRPAATPAPLPLPAVESSALLNPKAGDRWLNPADGAVYVYVPGGSFQMGSTSADAVSPREEPQHEVTVASFWLQQTEVTNSQYGRCVAAGECKAPANERWDDPAFADHPVTDVTWAQASAYAEWAGGRLPNEAEWERACRSDDGRTYAWGNEAATDALANFDSAIGDTAAVGSYPAGQSAYGLLDLSGNVWEWTSSLTADYPYVAEDGREAPPNVRNANSERTARGGSIYYTHHHIRCAARSGFVPSTASQFIGLRIVLK